MAEIPGVGRTGAAEILGEIGVDMTRFPSAAHLVSWAKFAPAVHESAGTKKQKKRPKGNPWLAATLGNVAGTQTRSRTFLGARYRRLARRRFPLPPSRGRAPAPRLRDRSSSGTAPTCRWWRPTAR